MDEKFKNFMKEQGFKRTGGHGDGHVFSGSDVPPASQFNALLRQDDPCDFCGNDRIPAMYVAEKDEIICLRCVEQEAWKHKTKGAWKK
jgi:formylmethanofuran dehydrogenase subunit E